MIIDRPGGNLRLEFLVFRRNFPTVAFLPIVPLLHPNDLFSFQEVPHILDLLNKPNGFQLEHILTLFQGLYHITVLVSPQVLEFKYSNSPGDG